MHLEEPMHGSDGEGDYSVVWPRGRMTVEVRPLAERLESLNGKTVCELWDYLFRGDEIFPWIRDGLRARFPDVDFVRYDEIGSTHGEEAAGVIAGLPRKLREVGADAVISAMGC